MRFYRSMPTSSVGYNFEVRQRVNGVYDKGKAGSVVETEYSLVDRRTDQIYATLTSSSFYVGQGGWGGPRGTFSSSNGRSVAVALLHSNVGLVLLTKSDHRNHRP